MDKLRLALIVLHVLITIFLCYHLHPKVVHTKKSTHTAQRTPSVLVYLNDLFRVAFYHSSCIIGIWFSRRYAAGVVRATGVLLIGEFFDVFVMTIKHLVVDHDIHRVELIFDVIYVWLFFAAIFLTYRLAKNITKFHQDLMRSELLTTTTARNLSMDERGDFALV